MYLERTYNTLRGIGDPNLDVDIVDGAPNLPHIYIDISTEPYTEYIFDDNLVSGSKWVEQTIILPTGLEAIDEGNGIGWRLRGKNPLNYGNIGFKAVDLSVSEFASSTIGATGANAVVFGLTNTASGNTSTSFGGNNTSSGVLATTWGGVNTASGNRSTAWGTGNQATADNTTAFGATNTATTIGATVWGTSNDATGGGSTVWGAFNDGTGSASTVWGRYNEGASLYSTVFGSFSVTPVGQNPTVFVPTDDLLTIGNGTAVGVRSNALKVLKNGTITAPSLTNALIDTAGNRSLITKEYLDTNINSSTGLEAIDEGNGIGWRLIGKNPANYGNIGLNAVDFSHSSGVSATRGATADRSTAFGFNTTASYYFAMAWGEGSIASGSTSTAWGKNTIASSTYTTVWGVANNVSGYIGTSWGQSNVVSGTYGTSWGIENNTTGSLSTTWGKQNTAASFFSTSFGHYSIVPTGQSPYTIASTDDLFTIGNGVDSGNRSNALKILKNAVQIVGGITATAASALTPEEGMFARLTDTNGTFTSVGFWAYEGGAWNKL